MPFGEAIVQNLFVSILQVGNAMFCTIAMEKGLETVLSYSSM